MTILIVLIVALILLICGLVGMLAYQKATEIPSGLKLQITTEHYREMHAAQIRSGFDMFFIKVVVKIGLGVWLCGTLWQSTTMPFTAVVVLSSLLTLIFPWWFTFGAITVFAIVSM